MTWHWGDVVRQLKDMGSTNWYAATREAKQCGCSPEDAMRIISYGKQNGRSLAAIQCRLSCARSSLSLTDGWLGEPEPLAAAESKPVDPKRQERLDGEATYVIRAMRKAGRQEPEILAKLAELGLEWPR
jgi:hypothetical protein